MYKLLIIIKRVKRMITSAIQRGDTVYVYGKNNDILMVKTGELNGYAYSTVSIKNRKARTITTYDDNGCMLYVAPAF